MAGINDLAASILQMNGQGNFSSPGNNSARGVYPAIVVSTDDPTGQNRIKARIVTLDNEGKVSGGKDRDKLDKDLVYCYPLIPEFFHVRPIPQQLDSDGSIISQGEMVWIILENSSDDSAPRYWVGPIISSQLKLKYQAYAEAVKMTDITAFNVNIATNNNFKVDAILPGQADVAVQGRDDADLILKPRQLILSSGKFKPNTITPNDVSPSNVMLTQFDNNQIGPLKTFSQANIQSTNINIYSPIGKFRDQNLAKFEVNENLKSFGSLADSLHPAVLGDELVKLLDVIIRVLLTHIHTPQNPLLPTPDSEILLGYTVRGELQNIISNVVRVN
jgi:hypothetical protein